MRTCTNRLLTAFVATVVTCLTAVQALAQIDVTYPTNRMVVQRDNNNQATVQVAGSFSQGIDRVEARVVARAAGQGTNTDWTAIQLNPINGQFNGNLVIKGGWYQLEVRGLRNGQVVGTDVVERFGVGEVFAILGHSNAQGSSCYIDGVDYCPTREGANDDRVTVVPLHTDTPDGAATFYQYELTADTRYLPGLAFEKMLQYNGPSPFSKVAWLWGRMGDVLTQRINVPVLIYNAGFGGSNMEHVYKSAYDIPFEHGFIRYDLRMPFVNIRNLMNLYVPSTGLRAVLIHHGENDRGNPTDLIVTHHFGVIDKTRQEFNQPNLGFIVAKSSFVYGPFDNVRQAQTQVINRANYNTYPGPDIDQITSREDRPDGLHFSPAGQARAGELWANAITDDILQRIQPILPQAQPIASIACAPTGNQLVLTQPDGYEYSWSNGSTDRSQTVGAGTYSARLRSPQKRILFPPAVTVPAEVRPATPSISTSGSETFCKAGSVTLTSNYNGPNLWSTGATTQSITIPSAGTYTLKARNPAYGCLSDATTRTVNTGGTDLALSLQASRRTPAVGDTVTFFLTVRNEGGCDAGNITVQNRLPANLAFVSSGNMTAANGIVSGTIASLSAGNSVVQRYVARLTAAGNYVNAAELTASSGPDPDSQPNSGTGDGQDDAASTQVRTLSTETFGSFNSPNPNQTPLPAVQSNQPAPDPAKADLSLVMQASRPSVRIGQPVTFTLTIRNRGGQTATNITVRDELPAGLQFASSASGMTANGTVVTGSIAQLAAGQEVSLSFVANVTGGSTLINAAQISAAGQPDPDSQPGNGTTNGEDDTAQVSLRVNGAASGGRLAATENTTQPATSPKPSASTQHRFTGQKPNK